MPLPESFRHDPTIRLVTGTCPHDCPDTCAWEVAVERATGRAVAISGHPAHPITQGRLCGKVDRYLERTYHDGRLRTPMRRVGPKGSGQFEAISWEVALREISDRLRHIIAEHGPEAVLPYSYAGTMGLLQGEGVAERFFNRLGASALARTICSEAGFTGYQYTMGRAIGMDTPDIAHARLILIWGSNTLTSNMHLWPFVQQARAAGATVRVIDPAQTRTAQAADEWIPIRPTTDGALALAMMQVIVAEGLYDAEYVAAHTLGFTALAERLRDYPPEWAAPITGVPAERIRALAREYATVRPAAIRVNYGMQRHAGGGMAMRTIACLPALVGAWRERGGGIQLSTSGSFPFDRSMLYRPDLRQRLPRTFNMIRLGDILSLDPEARRRALYHPRPADPLPTAAEAATPVKAVIVYNCNPAAVAPDQGRVVAGLCRDDLLTVVLEQFQTDTADTADYVLPATTQLEHWDLVKPYGHLLMGLNRPAIAPLGEALPNSEIFRRLAAAMGYDDPCFAESDEEMLRAFVEGQRDPAFATMTWEALQETGFVRLNLPEPFLPFAEGNYPTESGKCEFYSQRMADDGYDPLPTYSPEPPVPEDASAPAGESLQLISPPAHNFLNSSFVVVDRLRSREGEPQLWMHPDDAAARGIRDGAMVCVRNALGSVALPCWVTTRLIPGTVLAPGVWWAKLSHDGRTVNQLTPMDEADMGGGARFYDVEVWVEPLRPEPLPTR